DRHAVPLDHRVEAALAPSSMALGTYHLAGAAAASCGAGQAAIHRLVRGVRAIRPGVRLRARLPRWFLHTLHQVQAAYPDAWLETDDKSVTLHHSRPPALKTGQFS